MPSPFPGMDPYLEHPSYFHGLHNEVIVYMQEAIQPKLPPEYWARMGRRVWVEFAERHVEPDVFVTVSKRFGISVPDPGGGVATLDPPFAKPVIVSVPPIPDDEYRESFLEIYVRDEGERRLVTVVEVLSPANKKQGKKGRDLYLQKQHELLERNVHLVEIDLLRGGMHTTAVPEEGAQSMAGPYDYHVCIHQFDRPREFLVYPIRITEALPTIPIPLMPGQQPVAVNLQSVIERSYSTGAYDRMIDYRRRKPSPPLTAEQQVWAEGLIYQRLSLPEGESGTVAT
jgi:hypothetical protein